MPLPFTVEALDKIPEAQRGLYTKTETGFRLDVDGYEEPTALKSALEKERTNARDAVAQAKAWKALGKTPEEIQELVAAQAQAERDKLAKAGEWDKLREQMNQQHQAEIATREQAAKALRGQLERHLVDADAVTALAAAGGNAKLLLPHVKSQVRVFEENGEFAVRVVDAAGNPRVNGKGEFLSMTDLVGEMRQSDVYAPAFLAPPASGGGARPNAGAPGGAQKGKIDGTAEERTAYFAHKFGLTS
jgi:DNA-binding transcriptional MerR regulator